MVADGFGEAKPLGGGAPAPSAQPPAPPASQDFDVFASPVAPPPGALRLPDAPPVYHLGTPPAPPTAGPPIPPPSMALFNTTERNWMAIVSLVLGLLGGGLIGLGLGIAGLSAAKAGRATNRTMAIWGIVLNCTMWIVYVSAFAGIAALTASLSPPTSTLDENPIVDEFGPVYVEITALPPGTCFLEPLKEGGYLYDAEVVACGADHYGQVYAAGTLAEQEYISEAVMSEFALDLCFTDAAIAPLDPEISAELYASVYYPGLAAWQEGDRDYRCYVWDERGPLTESVLISPGVDLGTS